MNKDNIIKIAMIGAGLVSTILTTLNTERYIDKKISEKVDEAKNDIKNEKEWETILANWRSVK